jgi:hypothetical protein
MTLPHKLEIVWKNPSPKPSRKKLRAALRVMKTRVA